MTTLRTSVALGVLAAAGFLAAVAPAEDAGRPPRRHALLVAVSQYAAGQPLDALPRTEADVAALRAPLERGGYDVTLLSAEQAVASGKLDAGRLPTADNIRGRLTALAGSRFLDAPDTMLVVLSGHGVMLTVRTGPAEDAPTQDLFCFCPSDADLEGVLGEEPPPTLDEVRYRRHFLPIDDVYRQLDTGCKAGLKVLIADACRNDPARSAIHRSASRTLPRLPPPPGGVVALYSCSPRQRAFDDAELGHGVFFHYLLRGISPEADHSRDNVITLGELYDYTAYQTETFVRKKYGDSQIPEVTGTMRGRAVLLDLTAAGPAMPAPARPTPTPVAPVPLEGTAAGQTREIADLGLTLVWCPAQAFTMGSPPDEPGRSPNEDQVSVRLSHGFWIGRTELTQRQWTALFASRPWDGHTNVRESDTLDYPATCLSWESAMEYCEELTEREREAGRLPEGYEYALPTEAQRECACRAGTSTPYFFGADPAQLPEFAWYTANTYDVGRAFTQPVATRKPNPWGLYDIHGNASEWCRDAYRDKLPGGTDPFVPEGELRAIRDMSWTTTARTGRSAYRWGVRPDLDHETFGMRVALVRLAE